MWYLELSWTKSDHSLCNCRTALLLRSNVTDELVGQLSPLTNLRELSLRGCTGLTGAPTSGFARILAFARLECLDISNCKLLQVRPLFLHSCNCCRSKISLQAPALSSQPDLRTQRQPYLVSLVYTSTLPLCEVALLLSEATR